MAQATEGNARTPLPPLALGFAVDTTVVPDAWWGVDPARRVLPAVVRAWRDYLLVRHDPVRRAAMWTSTDRSRAADPDPILASESYLLDGTPLLVEALPIEAGDASRWVLRTLYVGGGSAEHPGVLGMERVHLVRETGADGRPRWAMSSVTATETAAWYRTRVGLLEYVVHPSLRFDAQRAAATAAWAQRLNRRFGIGDERPVTYYQAPNLQDALRVFGLELALSADRVGGRASPASRIVVAADPRYAEAYHHELVHVLLHPMVGARPAFVSEGIAYWLGGARGRDFAGMMQELNRHLDAHGNLDLAGILSGGGMGAGASVQLPAAAAIFELAFRSGGDRRVRQLIDAIDAEPTVAQIAAVLGTTPARLGADWRMLVRGFTP